MKTLIYVPIIHSSADMGSLGEGLKNKSISELGETLWQKHTDTVNGYWDAIESYFKNLEISVKWLKIFQDGMFADGEMALQIIREGVKSGSKNSIIVSDLISHGARLTRTEDIDLVMAEYEGIQSILKAKNKWLKILYLLRYKIRKPLFLCRRDKFIAGRIVETMESGETGILFIGAYHNIIKRLPSDFFVIQVKEISRIRSYQKAVQSGIKVSSPHFQQLAEYMVKK
jgi:hypothetical protein